MRIIIVGAGFTGVQLAKQLINGKNDVVIIDNNEDIVRHVSNRLDCDVIQADGNNLQILEDAGIESSDALVCVTSSDEVNMITCSLVDSVYPNILKIARVRNYAYYVNSESTLKKHAGAFSGDKRPLYGIDYMIHPDSEAAQAIVNAVEHGAVTDIIPFGENLELLKVPVEKGCAFEGIPLQDVRKFTDKHFLVAYVEREGTTSLPSGSTIIKNEDRLGLLLNKEDVPEFLSLCGSKAKELKKIALVGAGKIGTLVAEKLIHRKQTFMSKLFGLQSKISRDFVMIDSDEDLAKLASEKFPNIRVFHTDVTDESFVKEEGLDKFDLIICATHNHELNMVLAAYIESLGVENSITLVGTSAYADIAQKLGIEVAIPLRDAVVDSIMSHLKGKNVKGIHTLNDGNFEVIEVEISNKSIVHDKTLKEISENGKFLVLMYKRIDDLEYSIPTGNTKLISGDKVVIISKKEDSQNVLLKFGNIE